MGLQKSARNLLAQEPGRGKRHATAACTPNISKPGGRCQHHETADGCICVIANLDSKHRVVICKDGIQWILQKRKNGGAERPWRGLGYFRTKAALIRVCAGLNARVDPSAMAILAALPDVIGGSA